ncbi:MAG: hypothetical protein WD187_00315 [Candidatus Woykebacteria bacterium]
MSRKAIIRCVDPRYNDAIAELLEKMGLTGSSHIPPFPVPGASLSAVGTIPYLRFVIGHLDVSEIWIVDHLDCKAYELQGRDNDWKSHVHLLRSAEKKLRASFPNCVSRLFLMPAPEEDGRVAAGKVEEIG